MFEKAVLNSVYEACRRIKGLTSCDRHPFGGGVFLYLKLVVTYYKGSRKRDDSMTVFVGNLPHKATGDSILKLFGDNTKSVRIPTSRYGFVDFKSIESRDAAFAESWELDGRQLIVEHRRSS